MLGEKILEESGKVTGQRVLSNEGSIAKLESSFQASGQLLGVAHTTIATYTSVVRPDGNVYGEGNGIVMGENGEMATWIGQGMGVFKGGGAVSYRGAIYYQSSDPKWARLNNVAAIFEHEIGGDGTAQAQVWEWK
ncbi:MAG: hypothetical protein CMN78_04270 [Spirochaetales bacterium]|nr:hypothetical protein [Spirochaetales bacterium]